MTRPSLRLASCSVIHQRLIERYVAQRMHAQLPAHVHGLRYRRALPGLHAAALCYHEPITRRLLTDWQRACRLQHRPRPAPGLQITPPGPAASDAERLRALWHVSRRWAERLAWACEVRREQPDLTDRLHSGGCADLHDDWCLVAFGGLRFWWQSRLDRALADGERCVRGLSQFRYRKPTDPQSQGPAWDPLTQPLPGIEDTLSSGYYPVIPDYGRDFTFRQHLAYKCHWVLTQSVSILGMMDWDWSQATPAERGKYGAIIFVGSLYSAELAAVAGMAVPRQPLDGFIPGLGIPELFAPPTHPVWRAAFTA